MSATLLSLPTSHWTRAAFVPVLVFISCCIDRNLQTDFWHHLARGRAIVERRELVNHDLFTYTVPGLEFQDGNWLTQVAYYFLYQTGGLALIQVVHALAAALMMGLLVSLCRRRSGSLMLAAAVGAVVFVGLWQVLIPRPQTFSFLLYVLLYAILERAEENRRWLVAAPLIMALWANVHGGFPVGLVLVGCYFLAGLGKAWWTSRWRLPHDPSVQVLGACLGACLLATFLNPYGPRIYQYVGLTSRVASLRQIDEWLPPGLDLLVSKVWVVSLVGMMVLFALPGRRPQLREIVLVLIFLPATCGSVRMVAWWLLVCAPLATSLLVTNIPSRILGEEDNQRSWGNACACGLFALAAVFSLPWLDRHNPVLVALDRLHRTETDLQIVADAVRERKPSGRLFSRFAWSEYLGYEMTPAYAIFMDGRIEIYPDRIWAEYSAITRGRADWQQILDRHAVDCLILDRKSGYHRDLLAQVEQSSAVWQPIATSGPAVAFLRRTGPEAQVTQNNSTMGVPSARGSETPSGPAIRVSGASPIAR